MVSLKIGFLSGPFVLKFREFLGFWLFRIFREILGISGVLERREIFRQNSENFWRFGAPRDLS